MRVALGGVILHPPLVCSNIGRAFSQHEIHCIRHRRTNAVMRDHLLSDRTRASIWEQGNRLPFVCSRGSGKDD